MVKYLLYLLGILLGMRWVSLFLITMTKYLSKSTWREKGLFWLTVGLKGTEYSKCIIAEKAWQQAGRQLFLPHPVRKQREAMLMFSCLFLVPPRSPAHGMVPPTPRQVFPPH